MLLSIVSNPVYRKDDHIVFQGASNNITTPDDADNIYAEPFGHINGTNVHSTDLTPLDSTTGYQDLLAKTPETGEINKRGLDNLVSPFNVNNIVNQTG